MRLYFPRAGNAGQQFSLEYNKVLFRDVLLEDASTSEKIQSVLASGAKTHFILQDQELLIRHDLKVIEDCVGFYRKAKETAAPACRGRSSPRDRCARLARSRSDNSAQTG